MRGFNLVHFLERSMGYELVVNISGYIWLWLYVPCASIKVVILTLDLSYIYIGFKQTCSWMSTLIANSNMVLMVKIDTHGTYSQSQYYYLYSKVMSMFLHDVEVTRLVWSVVFFEACPIYLVCLSR